MGESVAQIAIAPPYSLSCASGLTVAAHFIIWVTQATAPAWIQSLGLKTDERGFVLVNNALQSLSPPQVFPLAILRLSNIILVLRQVFLPCGKASLLLKIYAVICAISL